MVLLGSARLPADCTLTNLGILPLSDLGSARYQQEAGGLYAGNAATRPLAHEAAGIEIAAGQIQPLNPDGIADRTNGVVVLLSLGMSNTSMEWASGFMELAATDPSLSPQLRIVDGAVGGQDAQRWTNHTAGPWDVVVTQRLVDAGVTTNQVQVMWIKQALGGPDRFGVFPFHAQVLKSHLALIVRNAKSRYPNLKLVYLSSRTRAYTSQEGELNPEPFAFESAFAVKWTIEDQLGGDPDLNWNPANGDVVAPWLSWGPYLWADGLVPRSDGFIWECDDVARDFTHPTSRGRGKVGAQLLAFFKTDPTTRPWFLRGTVLGQPPVCEASADVTAGVVPLTVHFSAAASDPDGFIREIQWTYGDGTFSTNANPVKTFHTQGIYRVQVTVTDSDGNTTTQTVAIKVVTLVMRDPVFTSAGFQFDVEGPSGQDYVVMRSEGDGEWVPIATNSRPGRFIDAATPAAGAFYRAVVGP